MGKSFILKGNICHTPRLGSLEIREHACIVCAEGTCGGIFDNISQIPEQYRALEVIDCGDSLVLPGMVDLHIHAPQYAFRGTGMDYELLKWLDRVTFPEEIRYADTGYAARAYEIFSNGLKKGATTRAVIFGTIHVRSTLILMDCMEKSGLISFVGAGADGEKRFRSGSGYPAFYRREQEAWIQENKTDHYTPFCSNLYRRADGGSGKDQERV